ncbi:amidohydrolase [Maribacter hydrothermalis]|uniref:Amidohydrolase n=1 Tax=Maribacter hydrothermalis TaxID=1836467 RepID=A0A1B7ZC00_9FLAO|nr:amidohydrolase [Maribacter hydrothermalis]APQ16030.1 amidohydrolase [Maribacter hydrothermalis]OBR40447.1 amidohydrolase [Maribacter hydrothermalis]
MNKTLVQLRKRLHKYPELSGEEYATAKQIIEFVKEFKPTKIIDSIGGAGVAVVYEFENVGPTVVIRCELDALPIVEENTFAHQSKNSGVSHKCGHDGHMAIVAGLAEWLSATEFDKGNVVLLFQPAEETGKGATKVLEDDRFLNLNPDYVFALHNLPGEKIHSIIVKSSFFTATVQSFRIQLTGKKSHASEPENGVNPAMAISQLIQVIHTFANPNANSENFALLTPICIDLGEKNYGISPENAELHYTIRTWSGEVMSVLENKIKQAVSEISNTHTIKAEIDWFEFFPASNNNTECVGMIEKVANENNFELVEHPCSLKFGEDFGWFSLKYKSAIFGLGAGKHQPALHHADYDFPDEIIATGLLMFKGLITEILGK